VILEVRHLRVLEAVRREGSVSQAARSLHLTQPAVSHALRDLEDRLGVPLFARQSKKMEATAAGHRLLESADVVLGELHRAEEDIARFRTGHLGTARITTQCYTCYHWLPSILKQFHHDYPDVDIQIIPEATSDPMRALLDRKLDLAIVHDRPKHKDLVAEPIFRDELVALVSPDHPFAGRPYLEAADFESEHAILHSDPADSALFRALLMPAGVTPRRVSKIQLTEAVVETVKANLGVSVMARWAVRPELEAGTLVAMGLTSKGLYRTWYAATRRGRDAAPMVESLVAMLKSDALGAVEAARD
jgi:LysR family transcriptional regulator for metE and metH